VGTRSALLVQTLASLECASTPKYHAADKHDNPPVIYTYAMPTSPTLALTL